MAMRLSLVVSLSATPFAPVAMREGWTDLDRVAAMGFDGVELAIRDPADVDGRALVERCTALSLPVPALGTGQAFLREGLSLTSPMAGIRRATIERLRRHIHVASMLNAVPGAPSGGVQVIVGLIRGWAGADRAATLRRLREGLGAVLPEADASGVGMVIEPISRFEMDTLNTVDEALTFIREVGHPRLGVMADTFHMSVEEIAMEASLRRAAPYLRHVHVADSNRRPPGSGHLDFNAILDVLAEIGYDGYLSGEMLPYPDPEGAAKALLTHLRPLQRAVSERRGMT